MSATCEQFRRGAADLGVITKIVEGVPKEVIVHEAGNVVSHQQYAVLVDRHSDPPSHRIATLFDEARQHVNRRARTVYRL